jgi:hypothetical protein
LNDFIDLEDYHIMDFINNYYTLITIYQFDYYELHNVFYQHSKNIHYAHLLEIVIFVHLFVIIAFNFIIFTIFVDYFYKSLPEFNILYYFI